MRKYFIASALLAASVTAAKAADVVVQEPDAAYDWSGPYLGVQAGYGWGKSGYRVANGAFADPDPDGFIGGAYIGYNKQLDSGLVLGVDADFAFSQIDGAGVFPLSPIFVSNGDVNWNAAVRARIGYRYDRFLPYIAGGIAIADYHHDLFFGATHEDDFRDIYTGWTIGGGVEYAVTGNLLLRGEYRYSDFGSASFDATPRTFEHKVNLRTNDFRIGIAYKF
ncbi:outer membrane protein [Pseudaminobacter soli (ex Li et al. 2025)]|uniref:outer membrane protein n=1 Tax=Pseudaminobacter soli (ex Li et al. 2025) TaxID=1295366 RepID=UPI002475D087|nr:porin family protein [Mesorhizobium soli]